MGHTELVELLLDYNANFEQLTNNGETPLLIAVGNGYTAIVKMLLAKGANREAIDSDGNNLEAIALAKGHNDIVALLDSYKSMTPS